MRIPDHILLPMESAYRSHLAEGGRGVLDDRVFHRGGAEAGARWHLVHLVHRLPDALRSDRQRGPTTLRQQVVVGVEAFADLSEEFGQMQAVGKSARDMLKTLRPLWPAAVSRLPSYPAFRGGG